MRIGIIGAGNVGRALGRRWARGDHEITFGVREPESEKYRDLLGNCRVQTVAQAAAEADVIVLATPWDATEDAIRACGDLSERIVVDCTNPLKPELAGLTHGFDDSGGEQVARWAEGAKVVKAFNSVGTNIMEDPSLEGRHAVMFIAGDENGKILVHQLSDELGFETIDAGDLGGARLLEPLAMLWIKGAYQLGLGRDFAFSLIRKEEPGS